jgi:tripartite-type tricarboxylate transporter receptor subunit TctC
MFRTNLLRGSALAAMLALSSVSAFAEQMSIVTPFPPGGISDSMARVVASYLSEELGETVIVDPQPGASGLVAARHVLNQEADGTVLFQTSPTVMMILPRTNKLEFNPREAFQTVSNVGSNQLVFAVRKDYPADTLAEFIDHVSKQEPGSLSLASGGAGTSTHLIPVLFLTEAGLDFTHVPYSGGGPALQDVVAGHVDAYFGNPSEVMAQAEGGNVKILATSGDVRMKSLPDVPTISEALPGVSLVTWNGMVVKQGTPVERIEKISAAIQAISLNPDYIKALEELGIDVIGDDPAHFQTMINDTLPLWNTAIDAAGIEQQ